MSAPLTFLFTDIEASSRLWDERPEQMRSAHRQHNALLRSAIDEHGGSVVKDRGDGFMAVFDDPAAALRAAADGQRKLQAADWSPLGRELRVRMGVHTGPAEHREGDYFGPDVNIAARLEGLANGRQILLSDATRALTLRSLSDGLSTRDLGHFRLKGIGQRERVHQLDVAGLVDEFPPLSGESIGRMLPVYPGAMLGRREDVDAILSECRKGTRLVTLLGPGGIGKTRLAVEAARLLGADSDMDTYFADMAPIRVSAEVGPTFAEAVGVHVEGTADPFELVAARITEPTVTVLDNLEHLSGLGPSLAGLLSACPSMTLIATSRSPLRIQNEVVYPLAPLDIGSNGSGAAVELFYERAHAAGVRLGAEDRSAVRSLCRRIDGLPLAIELVAAQTRLLSVSELDSMLGRSLDALGRGGDDRPDRHRTIRDTIEWSLSGLTDRMRSIFAELSIFPAGATLAQLAFVRDEDASLLINDLEALTDNSLVAAHTGLPGGTRFRQLALLREYGAELLEASGRTEQKMNALVDYYVANAANMQTGLLTENQTSRELAQDHQNLVAAMEWSLGNGRAEEMASFLADIWIYWFNGDRTETVAEFVRQADSRVASPKLDWLGGFVLGFQLGDFEAAGGRMARAEQAFLETGDDYWAAMARLWLGTVSDDPESSRVILESAYAELSTHTEHPAIRPLALLFLSMSDVQAGDLEKALERRRAATELARQVGHPELMAWLPWNVASVLTMLGRYREAAEQLPNAFEFMVDDAYQEGIASFAHLIGILAIRLERLEAGLAIIGTSDAIMDRIGVAVWGEVALLRSEAVAAAVERLGEDRTRALLAEAETASLAQLIELGRATLAAL